jgi:hypothetical protein
MADGLIRMRGRGDVIVFEFSAQWRPALLACRNVLQAISGRFLVRISLGRDRRTGRRRYHNRTLRGGLGAAQAYLNCQLAELDRDRDLQGSEMTCIEYFDHWLELGARPRLRAKSYRDYQSLLRRYVRPSLGQRRLRRDAPLDIQALYPAMEARGLSSRTIRYTHAVVHSALGQAVRWRLICESDGRQVFANLISNAADAMQRSPVRRLLIRIRPARTWRTGGTG